MASVDTNVLLRWLMGDVPDQYERASRLILGGDRLVVPDEALIEVVSVIEQAMRLTRGTAIEALSVVLATATLDLDRERWREIVDIYGSRPKLSIVDVYLAVTARVEGDAPLYAFDRKLASQLDDVVFVPLA